MTIGTIKKLNQLNRDFYQQVAIDFDQTRQHLWPGWNKLISHLQQLQTKHKPLKVLDLGCGNGRFGQFLANSFPGIKINYLGVDNNPQLFP